MAASAASRGGSDGDCDVSVGGFTRVDSVATTPAASHRWIHRG